MSQPSRPRPRGSEPRRRRELRIETIQVLEDRVVLTPFLPLAPDVVTFTAAATPTNTDLGTVSVSQGVPAAAATSLTAAPVTSVSELTPISSFGGDIVQIQAGPGGVFGNDVYAISRGAGANAANGAVNRPGVIYRVDPATGKASVFFDLNTVINQIDPGQTAANSVGASTGLVNWYNITFDPEGYFNGQPAMFVTSVDRSDPAKNAIYEISPSGQFLGLFAQFTQGESAAKFNVNPTSILVPPVQDQSFLRGLFAGAGAPANVTVNNTTAFSALYFDANSYTPAQVLSNSTLPTGVVTTDLTAGPQLGLTASNIDYPSAVYSVFTDFGTPGAGGLAATPGNSGVQGLDGEFPISPPPGTAAPAAGTVLPLDEQSQASSLLRRFDDIAFDQYGYFSQGFTLTTPTTNTATGTVSSSDLIDTPAGDFSISTPRDAGNLFVADLASGLEVQATPLAPLPGATIEVPVQGNGTIGVQSDGNGGVTPILTNDSTTGNTTPDQYTNSSNLIGGRIMRIQPNGVMTVFAEGFDVSPAQDSTSLANSSLSISFSADGTILYAADDDAIWQFKTQTDLADSSSGQLIGLNDLRSLGVPYDGLGSAVAIVDTGVDANSTPFRGRVATGTNVVTNGFGNDDLAPGIGGTTTTTGTGAATGAAGTTNNTLLADSSDGHGTLVAGVVAQFVPQATIEPVDIFSPFLVATFPTSTLPGGGAGTTATGTTGSVSGTSNATTSTENVYKGMAYVAEHPFVNDPVRPNTVDRVIAATFGFGTTITFNSEEAAYQQYPQIVLAFKGAMAQYKKLGIAPIAAAGQFGAPLQAGASTTTGVGAATGTTTTGGGVNNNAENANVGDNNGMALPAALNDVISVTGSIPFPFSEGPSTPPTDPVTGVIPRPGGPLLIYSEGTIGGVPSTTTTGGAATGAAATATGQGANLTLLTAANFEIYSDRILASANRDWSTDFAAPAIDVPTFRRTFAQSTTTTTTTSTTTTDARDHNVFDEAGTSLSAGIVTGAYSMVSSALNYWAQLNSTPGGVTSDAYLTTPVGVNTLTFGNHPFINLQAYNNPNGINSILAWTADLVTDPNDGLSASTPPTLPNGVTRNYDRLSISNAIAAIEGDIAINYLLAHNDFQYIDTNNNGLITAQELQNFEDNATQMGMPEAGAMARLLGGTAQIPVVSASTSTPTSTSTTGGTGATGTTAITAPFITSPPNGENAANEAVEEPSVLQRRFNFFDYAADGQLNGSISIPQLKMLSHTLLPTPDSFSISNRARASANGTLLNPTPDRNFQELQHLLPSSQLVPNKIVEKFARLTPKQFKIDAGRDQFPGQTFPLYSLFAADRNVHQGTSTPSASPTSTSATSPTSTGTPASSSPTTTPSTTTSPQTAGSLTASSPTPTTTAATMSPSATTTPTPTGTTTSSTDSTSSSNAIEQLLQAALALDANGTSGTTSGVSTPQTAGTLTPIATPTATAASPTLTVSPSVTMSQPPAQTTTTTTPGTPIPAGTLTPVPTPTPTPSGTSTATSGTSGSSTATTPTTTPTSSPTPTPTTEAQQVVNVPATSTVTANSPTSVTITPKTKPKKATGVINTVLNEFKKLF